jgi:hypothetical protein
MTTSNVMSHWRRLGLAGVQLSSSSAVSGSSLSPIARSS